MNYMLNNQAIEEDQEWYDGLGHQEDPEMKEAIKIQDPISAMTLSKPIIIDLGTNLRHVLDKMQENKILRQFRFKTFERKNKENR